MIMFLMYGNISYEFILLNIHVFYLGSNSQCNFLTTLCESSYTVALPIPSVFLSSGLLMENIKIRYYCHEVPFDNILVRQ